MSKLNGKTRENSPAELLEEVLAHLRRHHERPDQKLIIKAFELAERIHAGQQRATGGDFLVHPLAVARRGAELGLDVIGVSAAILHDCVEDGEALSIHDIEKSFGEEVAHIVDGLTKIRIGETTAGRDPKLESLKKLLIRSLDDARTLLVKVLDRDHNLRSVEAAFRRAKAERIALETLHLYVGLARRMGLLDEARRMEETCLRVLNPGTYRALDAWFLKDGPRSKRTITSVAESVAEDLTQRGIQCEHHLRRQGLPEIHRDLRRRRLPPHRVADSIPWELRIVVPDRDACYRALSSVHDRLIHLATSVRDQISNPSLSGHQFLQTTCFGPDGIRVRVIIQDQEMWQWRCVASRLKEGVQPEKAWIEELISALQETDTSVLPDLTNDVASSEEVEVFSPDGDRFKLPASGSTALDFAYAVHTEIGDRAEAAVIDGRRCSLRTPLRNDQRVEIIVSKDERNTVSFNRLDWVSTNRARAALRRALRREEQRRMEEQLAETSTYLANQLGLDRATIDEQLVLAAQHLELGSAVDLGREIFAGRLDLTHVALGLIRTLPAVALPRLHALFAQDLPEIARSPDPSGGAPEQHRAPLLVLLDDMLRAPHQSDLPVRIGSPFPLPIRRARCCRPVPGDAIVARTAKGRGAVIHRSNCRQVRHEVALHSATITDASWLPVPPLPVSYRVRGADRPGLLLAIARVFVSAKVEVQRLTLEVTSDGLAIGEVTALLAGQITAKELRTQLDSIHGLTHIEQDQHQE